MSKELVYSGTPKQEDMALYSYSKPLPNQANKKLERFILKLPAIANKAGKTHV